MQQISLLTIILFNNIYNIIQLYMKKLFFILFIYTIAFTQQSIATTKCKSEICRAILAGNTSKVRAMLVKNKKLISHKESFGTSLLQIAIENKDKEISDLLISHNINLFTQDIGGATAIHTAIRYNFSYVISKILDKNESVIDIQDKEGHTPLMRAIALGRSEIVDILLKHKPNCNTKNKNGNTAKEIPNYKLSKNTIEELNQYISKCQK